MKTFFVEIVYNNTDKTSNGMKFLRAVVSAKDKETAGQKVLIHFQPYYTAGDKGEFRIQCNWEVKIPTREIYITHWKNASRSLMPMAVNDQEGKTIGYRYFQPDTRKKEVIHSWDICNINWANPAVYFDPNKGGYIVAIHGYMCMPSEFMFFKGVTAETYKKAKQWVKENTFKGNYYCPF